MNGKHFLFTSESVTGGHPDKVCDQISDAVLDAVLKDDPKGRVACETFITVGLVIVGGEITTHTYVDIANLARRVIRDIGYTHAKYGFNYETCAVLNAIGPQSPDISQGVDTGGAGDQGLMIGYASKETKELMPLPITLSQKLTMRLRDVREKSILPYLGPDGKSQVTVQYENGKPTRVDTVVIAAQHTDEVLDRSGHNMSQKAKREIVEEVIKKAVPERWMDRRTKFYVNETGKFVVGGPQSDTGMTGRKIIVDTYGGMAAHGGGAFSGKDPSKVDRSASYMARYVAKNVVASGIARECTVQLAYAIGVPEPVSVLIHTHGEQQIEDSKLSKLVRETFDLTPRGIIKSLKLLRPIYQKTAAYGHFGRNLKDFTWENTDKAQTLKRKAASL
jgi:S-adenosylmethionine synthetase